MSHVKVVVIEQKSFEVVREGRWLFLTEKGRKFVISMRMELATARWFSKALEDGRNARRKGFYASHREGDRGFMVQRCANFQGEFMVMEEYQGGGRRRCILVPDEKDGRGWWKLAELLREASGSGGQAPPAAMKTLKPASYKEALQQWRPGNQSHQLDRRAVSGVVSGAVSVGEEDGRRVVGLQKEMVVRVLSDMQNQLGELQEKICFLKKCVEEQECQLGAALRPSAVDPRDGPKAQSKGKAQLRPGPSDGRRPSRLENRPSGSVWRRRGASLPHAAVGPVVDGGALPQVTAKGLRPPAKIVVTATVAEPEEAAVSEEISGLEAQPETLVSGNG
ncbi:hypothetical protein F2P56_002891 [Juglans regia]|uniref:Uncharacterized protein n=1 Tax=Juglans regia TaxID=51240 RepID=A0A833YAZ5_JUGRE|nr:hypothetical protein F2P56_002891 [Juglans regia]